MAIPRIAIDLFNPGPDKIQKVSSLIAQGKIVALPTETVYGIAALKDDSGAIEKLYRIKKRPKDRPFTVHVSNKYDIDDYVGIMPPYAYRFIERFWPGPLTIISFARNSGKVGVRCPDHAVTRQILKAVKSAVVMPSANIFGAPPALTVEDVEKSFSKDDIDFIVECGDVFYGMSSTIIDLEFHPFKVLREGAVSKEELLRVLVTKKILFVCTGNTCRSVVGEYSLKSLMRKRRPEVSDFYEIASAGVWAVGHSSASGEALEYLLNEGVDASAHRSRKLTLNEIRSSDIILVMEEAHRDVILKEEPTASERVFLLSKFLDEPGGPDIEDPAGKSREDYKRQFSLIKEAVLNLSDWL